jgi:hypothetical protein
MDGGGEIPSEGKDCYHSFLTPIVYAFLASSRAENSGY